MSKKNEDVAKKEDDSNEEVTKENDPQINNLDSVDPDSIEISTEDDEITLDKPELGPEEPGFKEPDDLRKELKPEFAEPKDLDLKAEVESEDFDSVELELEEKKVMTVLQFLKYTSYSREVRRLMYEKFKDEETYSEMEWAKIIKSLMKFLNKKPE